MNASFPKQLSLTEAPSYLSSIEEHEDYFLLKLQGAIDMSAIAAGRPIMDKVIKQHRLLSKHVICDLSGVEHGDTASIAAVIMRLSEVKKAGKKLVFCKVPELLRNIIDISKVDQLIEIHDSAESAARTIQS